MRSSVSKVPRSVTWSAPFDKPHLVNDHVHVWRFALDLEQSALQVLWSFLSEEERLRTGRFQFVVHRERFIAARGILRLILALYENRESVDLHIGYGVHGKPYLVGVCGASDLHFNLSHSAGLAVLAVGCNGELGVDLERVDFKIDVDQIASRLFSPQEVMTLQALPADRRHELFFLFWPRKEAYIKALGVGLSGQSDTLLMSGASEIVGAKWWRCDLDFGPSYVGALVVRSEPSRLVQLDLDLAGMKFLLNRPLGFTASAGKVPPADWSGLPDRSE